jgi:penicillin-binding protein 1B
MPLMDGRRWWGSRQWRGLKVRIYRSSLSRKLWWSGLILVVASLVFGFWLMRPFWQLSSQFANHRNLQPSRLYGRSVELQVGGYLPADQLVARLEETGYRREAGAGDSAPSGRGLYRRGGGSITVSLRRFPTPAGPAGDHVLEVVYRGQRIQALRRDGGAIDAAYLEPPVIASYYGDDFKERRPVVLEELPDHLIQAVLAAEDDSFFRHAGVSIKGLLRAFWINLRNSGSDATLHGGSTLTQQLVKNIYLTHERTLMRKLREGVLAVMLDARYSKEQILQAYLNEIYLGASGGVNLIGVGAASWAIFGKDARDLDLAESATLAGMIKSPAHYSPLSDPERARLQRNRVLDHLAELERLDAAAVAAAREEPMVLSPQRPVRRRAPYFADAAAEEARRRYGVEALEDSGYSLLSTLSWSDQQVAEEAVAWGLKALEDGWEKDAKVAGPLQAALVSIDPDSGDVLSWIGGRDYGASQFDRASSALRQAGSAFKPAVYAAAIEAGVAGPHTLIEDTPLTVMLAGQRWSPHNDDDEFHGVVTVRAALERSLNVPTARLALMAGLDKVVTMAHGMGVRTHLEPYPALALGAFEVTPVEMATLYATLAAGGRRPSVHTLNAIYTAGGEAVGGASLPASEAVMRPQTAYLVTSILQGVLDRGTASRVRSWGVRDALAGKTGTSNDRRDSWFAGYSPERATAVWVGYDDNAPTRLGGSRAGLPIWARFIQRVRPATGYATFPQPPGITTALIDPESGLLATDACPTVLTEVFLSDQVPQELCTLHDPWRREWRQGPRDGDLDAGERRRVRGWLRRLFGADARRDRRDREGTRRPPDRRPRDGDPPG